MIPLKYRLRMKKKKLSKKQTRKRCKMIRLKYGNVPDWKFDKRQLRMGVKTELEHTNSRALAKQISKAHLQEDQKYYSKLRKAGL
jgi:hypothetical protein